jgi:excisionase family DNA binding protein
MSGVLVIDVEPKLAGHMAIALEAHLSWLRRSRLREPEGLQELAVLLRKRATKGLPVTALDDLARLAEADLVTPMTLTYEQAATVLNCSVRHVKRLAAKGDLPTVDVGGLARIRVADLDQFVRNLTPRRAA